jgi:hypothetical protein
MPYWLPKAIPRWHDTLVGLDSGRLDHKQTDEAADHAICLIVQPTATAFPIWSVTCEVCKSSFEDVSSASG